MVKSTINIYISKKNQKNVIVDCKGKPWPFSLLKCKHILLKIFFLFNSNMHLCSGTA